MAKDKPFFIIQKRNKNKKIVIPNNLKQTKRGTKTLIVPFSNTQWSVTDNWFRSLIIGKDKQVISAGLPKFHDHDNKNAPLDVVKEQWSEIKIYVKHDGRLIIRDVEKGQVIYRTRSSFDCGQYEHIVRELSKNKLWSNPSFYPDCSLHFELLLENERVVCLTVKTSLFI